MNLNFKFAGIFCFLPLRQQVRDISKNVVSSSSKAADDIYSEMMVEWGQFLDHGVTFTPQSSSMDCLTTCDNVHPCFPIEVSFTVSVPVCLFLLLLLFSISICMFQRKLEQAAS